jgi:hypothetical protein
LCRVFDLPFHDIPSAAEDLSRLQTYRNRLKRQAKCDPRTMEVPLDTSLSASSSEDDEALFRHRHHHDTHQDHLHDHSIVLFMRIMKKIPHHSSDVSWATQINIQRATRATTAPILDRILLSR